MKEDSFLWNFVFTWYFINFLSCTSHYDVLSCCIFMHKGPFNNYADKMRGGVGQKMSVFVHRHIGYKRV